MICSVISINRVKDTTSNLKSSDHPTENDADECFLGSVIARDEVVGAAGVGGGGGGGNEAAAERVCGLGGGEPPAAEREG